MEREGTREESKYGQVMREARCKIGLPMRLGSYEGRRHYLVLKRRILPDVDGDLCFFSEEPSTRSSEHAAGEGEQQRESPFI